MKIPVFYLMESTYLKKTLQSLDYKKSGKSFAAKVSACPKLFSTNWLFKAET